MGVVAKPWRESSLNSLSADLGGSSNYSNENFEGRSGEGFRVNSNWTSGYSILRDRVIPFK